MNKYGVEISGPGAGAHKPKLSGSELLCQLKEKVQVTTLTSDLRPFSLLPWASQLPLKQLIAEQGPFKSCAVVSSAGSLRKSGLGKEIGEDFYFVVVVILEKYQNDNHKNSNNDGMLSGQGCLLQLHLLADLQLCSRNFLSTFVNHRRSRCRAALQCGANLWLRERCRLQNNHPPHQLTGNCGSAVAKNAKKNMLYSMHQTDHDEHTH